MKISDYFDTIEPAPDRVSPETLRANRDAVVQRLKTEGPPKWYSRHEIAPGTGIFTEPGQFDFNGGDFFRWNGVDPSTLAGKRVLDIGAFAGSMSFAAEDFGARVVAIDVMDPATCGFRVLHELRGSTVQHVKCSIYDLHPDLFGQFDVVLFSGVHYHLRHPILALERVNSVMADGAVLMTVGTVADYWLPTPADGPDGIDPSKVSVVTKSRKRVQMNDVPVVGYYPKRYLDDRSNWFIPNTRALAEMIASCGFAIDREGSNRMPIRPELGLKEGGVGVASILAHKIGPPDSEYDSDVYGHIRRGNLDAPGAVALNIIPTRFDVARRG